ncbi:MAG: AbrB/MazE/SpoVT family DNA-binding domain-containing protein [Sphingomonadaceae bacterium]|nr:AbrB/MazE/SpoVT family DNA-binding domain-containing protein [Sphingomonadaceae bacterium]
MNAISSRTFKSGNSIALRLPRALGIGADVEMQIERNGDVLIVRRLKDPAEEKRRLREMVAELESLPKPPSVQEREPIEFPERPGL